MGAQHIGCGIPGFLRGRRLCAMLPKAARERLRMLHLWDNHGLAANRDAFGMSRRMLSRWKATLKRDCDAPDVLAARP